MSLKIWLPMNRDLRNQGLLNNTITNSGATYSSDGKLGGCYIFDGVDDSLAVGNLSTMVETDFSFACWFYKDEWGSKEYETIFGGPPGFELDSKVSSTNSPVLKLYNWGGGSCTYELSKWNHIVFTRNSTETKLYLNGELKVTGSAGTIPNNNNYFVGSWNSATQQNFKGKMCDVRIYDNCLSPMEVKQLSQGLVLHYPLNRNGWGQENFILESHKVTSGGNANGITRTYESDGSMKIVSTSGNGNYASLGFAQNSNTSVGNNMVVGDTYCISCDVKIETGTALPTLFINSGNGYKQLKPVNGSIITGKWIRVYYTSTWAEPGTQYGNISLHLGFSGAIGTYYFKNFKLEKGSTSTSWCPNVADTNNMSLNSTIEYDCSGFCNNGTWHGTHTNTSNTPKYAVSTTATGSGTTYLEGPVLPAEAKTVALWIKNTNKSSNGAIFNDKTTGLQIGLLNSLLYMNSKASTAGFTTTHWVNGEWNHVVAVNNNGTRSLYVNGQAETQSGASNYYIHNADNCWLWNRSYNNNYPFTGSLCDLRVYATALSADDVKSLYQNCATIDPDGTIRGQIRS